MLKLKEVFDSSESWNDGIINVLEAVDGVIESNKVECINYGSRTIGVNRFYQAKVAGDEIAAMISIPYGVNVSVSDLIEVRAYKNDSMLKSGIYAISQIQEKNTAPKSLYISLKKGDISYDDNRT